LPAHTNLGKVRASFLILLNCEILHSNSWVVRPRTGASKQKRNSQNGKHAMITKRAGTRSVYPNRWCSPNPLFRSRCPEKYGSAREKFRARPTLCRICLN